MFKAFHKIASFSCGIYSSRTVMCQDDDKKEELKGSGNDIDGEQKSGSFFGMKSYAIKMPQLDTGPNWGYDIYGIKKQQLSEFDRNKIYSVARNREFHLKELSDPKKEYDVIVIGGGWQDHLYYLKFL